MSRMCEEDRCEALADYDSYEDDQRSGRSPAHGWIITKTIIEIIAIAHPAGPMTHLVEKMIIDPRWAMSRAVDDPPVWFTSAAPWAAWARPGQAG